MSTYLWLLAVVVGVHPLDATRKGPVPALPGISSRAAGSAGVAGRGTEDDAAAATETGEEALSRASRARRESYGKEGEEKYRILERAAQEYEAVTKSHAGEVQVVAEAWFRAGEIYRGLRRVEEAQRCFQAAVALVKAPEYAARAMNELGHLERRQKNHAAAIAFYRRVRTEFPGERQEGVRALTCGSITKMSRVACEPAPDEGVGRGEEAEVAVGPAFSPSAIGCSRCTAMSRVGRAAKRRFSRYSTVLCWRKT